MREIKNMAQNMKDKLAALKAQYNSNELNAEIDRANTNSEKIKAFTQELKDANAEIESFLGETGSNFSPSEESATRKQYGPDHNGVTINQETKT